MHNMTKQFERQRSYSATTSKNEAKTHTTHNTQAPKRRQTQNELHCIENDMNDISS